LKGPVEAFGFAVGPGAAGLDEALDCPGVRNGLMERGGVAVGEGVVGDDVFDPVDVVAGEAACGAGEEPRSGGALLVGEDFGGADASVVIDRDVDVVVADPSSLDLLRAAVGPPAAAVRDASEFLDGPDGSVPRAVLVHTGWPLSWPRGSGRRSADRSPPAAESRAGAGSGTPSGAGTPGVSSVTSTSRSTFPRCIP